MNRHKKWGIIALVICIIGGIVMFSLNQQKEKTLEEKMRIEQDRMALYLVNHYEGVRMVEFESFSKDSMTGTWSGDALVNDKYYVRFTLWNVGGEISMSQLTSRNSGEVLEKRKQIDSKSDLDIDVRYGKLK